MTRDQLISKINEAIDNISFNGQLTECRPYGDGHINDTFLLQIKREDGEMVPYILQRMNHEIFKNPVQLMENIAGVTGFLKNKIILEGGNADRETITIIPAKDGKPYYRDSIGCYWRGYKFIEDATSFSKVEKPEHFYESAVSFGHFQNQLSDYPAQTLHETIPDFHNTRKRFETFRKAVEEDVCGRADGVRAEIDFVMARETFTGTLLDLYDQGKLPLRVTHNDTKLNNIMIDNKTGKGICVIDLDTVMPGFSVNDYGDSIRFGASTANEDEQDLSKVRFDMELFELYTRGYLEGCCGSLVDVEIDMLPTGAKMMTFECGMRFLTDHLQGDVYFKIHRPGHNLDRARTQFKLVDEMEREWDNLSQIVNKYR